VTVLPTDVPAVLAAVSAGLAVALVAVPRADRRGRALATTSEGPASVESADGSVVDANRVAALLDLIAAALDVGLAPESALAVVAVDVPEPDRSRLRRALAIVDMAGSDTAWQMLAADPVLGPLAQAFERSERSGAPIAAMVRGLADEARRDRRSARLAEARRVGVRTAAPLGACFLPAFFLIAIVPTVIALLRSAL
jgi:pilus assembly protein TadC